VSGSVMTEIVNYDMMNYLEERLVEKYSFFRRVSIENIMKWQNKEITQPLTKLSKEFEAVSIQLFRSI
jgi:hypothetical protein